MECKIDNLILKHNTCQDYLNLFYAKTFSHTKKINY